MPRLSELCARRVLSQMSAPSQRTPAESELVAEHGRTVGAGAEGGGKGGGALTGGSDGGSAASDGDGPDPTGGECATGGSGPYTVDGGRGGLVGVTANAQRLLDGCTFRSAWNRSQPPLFRGPFSHPPSTLLFSVGSEGVPFLGALSRAPLLVLIGGGLLHPQRRPPTRTVRV